MANEARDQAKDVRSLASQSGICSRNLEKCTDGGLPAALSGGVHSELFSHLGTATLDRAWPRGLARFRTGTAKGCPVWASLASVAAALPKARLHTG